MSLATPITTWNYLNFSAHSPFLSLEKTSSRRRAPADLQAEAAALRPEAALLAPGAPAPTPRDPSLSEPCSPVPHAQSRPRGGRSAARASRAALTHHLDPADGARIALHVPAPHGHRIPLFEREHFVASRLGACAPGVRGQGAGFLAVFHVGHGGDAGPAAETLSRRRRAAMAAPWRRPAGHSAACRPRNTAAPTAGAAPIGWRGPVTSSYASAGPLVHPCTSARWGNWERRGPSGRLRCEAWAITVWSLDASLLSVPLPRPGALCAGTRCPDVCLQET